MDFARSPRCLPILLLLAGCTRPDDGGGDASTGEATTATSDSLITTGQGGSVTTQDPGDTTGNLSEIMGDDSGTGTTAGSSSSSTGDNSDTSGDPVVCAPLVDPPPISKLPCEADADCPDGESCDVFLEFGGLCGLCEADVDCPDHGCTHNWLYGTGSNCNSGELGAGCESDAACQACAPHCAVVSELYTQGPDPLVIRTCGECLTSEDCPGGQACAVEYGEQRIGGANRCVAAGSLIDGQTCRLAPDGGLACASGICAEVNDHGISRLGVCGECALDQDCAAQEYCAAGEVEGNEVFPSQCLPA